MRPATEAVARTGRPRAGFLALVAAGSIGLAPAAASAWVTTYLERVETTAEVSGDGAATVEVTAWYVVQAGKFREFRIHDVPQETELDLAASWVEDEKGRRHAIELLGKRTPDGTVRFLLAEGGRIPKGRATCHLVLRENWLAAGRARVVGNRLEVDWRPPVFPDGMERLTIAIRLPEDGQPLEFSLPEDRVAELEPRSAGATLTLSRFRPPAMYEMPVRFAARRGGPEAAPLLAAAPTPAVSGRRHRSRPPAAEPPEDTLPFLVAFPLVGMGLLALRVRHARRRAPLEGGVQPYLFFPSIGNLPRWPVAALALAVGAWLLAGDRLLEGLGIQALAVLLALPDRFRWLERGVVGAGPWRQLAAPSPRTWRSLARATRRARRSWLDAGGPAGFALLLLIAGGAAFAVASAGFSTLPALATVVADAALLLLPPFLVASERALPPVLPAQSGFELTRVRRYVDARDERLGLRTEFLVQDDARGCPAEFRLRVRRPAAAVARSCEVAAEWRWTHWGWQPGFAVMLALPAGSSLRAGSSGFPRDGRCVLAENLGRETWIVPAPTARAAAARAVELLQRAETALAAVDAEPAEAVDAAAVLASPAPDRTEPRISA